MIDFSKIFNFEISLDTGSYRTRGYERYSNIFYNDHTYLTYSHINKLPVAYGTESKEMLGRVPKGMEVIRPIQNTEINNNHFFELYLKNVFNEFYKVDKSFRLKSKPKVYIPLPIDYTQSSMSNYKGSIEKSGAGEVIFLKKTPSSFYGLPRSKDNKKAIMIMDIGYQKTEIGVVYRDDTIFSKVLNFGGESIDKYLMAKILEDRKIQCSQNNIERYKEECLTYLPFSTETEKFKIVGKDIRKGSPVSQEISFAELREYVIPMIRYELVKQTKSFFNTLTDHIIGDIFEEGMYIVGGTAKNYSLNKFIEKELTMKTNFLKDSDLIYLKGVSYLIKHKETYKTVIQ